MAKLIETFRQEAAETAKVNLTNGVAALVERYRATSGMLFIIYDSPNPDQNAVENPGGRSQVPQRLIANVLLNVPESEIERHVSETEQGIVGRVAAKRRSYLNNCVTHENCESDPLLDAHYKRSVPSTRSELAVPIFAPLVDANGSLARDNQGNWKRELIGVLNLESRAPGTFSPLEVEELESAASSLSLDIQILQYAARHDRVVLWHPQVHGWGLSRILNAFCHCISNAAQSASGPSVSCTIWHADHEKRKLFVNGTARFDYEYESDSLLEWDSFMGQVAQEPRTNPANVRRGRVSDLREFRRPRKAERMELNQVIAVAIDLPLTLPTRPLSEGVLALYSFQHEAGLTTGNFDEVFSDGVMQRLADWAGRIIAEVRELRRAAALAVLQHRLISLAVPSFDEFEMIKNTVIECLEADAASIFVREDLAEESVLRCVATTGLIGDPSKTYPMRAHRVSLGRDERKKGVQAFIGMTSYLAEEPDRIVRKLDIPDPSESCGMESKIYVNPRNNLRESGALTGSAHRRFLGVTVSASGTVYGVVRLVRSEFSPPFVYADGELLLTLGALASASFKDYSILRIMENDTRIKPFRTLLAKLGYSGWRLTKPKPSYFGSKLNAASDLESAENAVNRILAASSDRPWHRRRLDSWLQDFLHCFQSAHLLRSGRPQKPIFTNIRIASDESDLRWNLELLAYHSARAKHVPWDDGRFPRTGTNIGWTAMDRKGNMHLLGCEPKAIRFDKKKATLYNCVIPHKHFITTGLTIPMSWVGYARYVQGAVSLDFESRLPDDSNTITCAFLAVLALNRMCARSRFSDSSQAPHGIESWLKMVAEWRNKNDKLMQPFAWAAVVPSQKSVWSHSDDYTELAKIGSHSEDLRETLQCVRQKLSNFPDYDRTKPECRWMYELERMGASWNQTHVLVPLKLGAFDAFDLIAEVTDQYFDSEIDAEARKIATGVGSRASRNLAVTKAGQSHLFRRFGTLVFRLADYWQRTLACDAWFWKDFEVSFARDPAPPMRSEKGLSFWQPVVKASTQKIVSTGPPMKHESYTLREVASSDGRRVIAETSKNVTLSYEIKTRKKR